jgi:hypothetical protein
LNCPSVAALCAATDGTDRWSEILFKKLGVKNKETTMNLADLETRGDHEKNLANTDCPTRTHHFLERLGTIDAGD